MKSYIIRCLGLDIRQSTKIRLQTITKVRPTSFHLGVGVKDFGRLPLIPHPSNPLGCFRFGEKLCFDAKTREGKVLH